MKNYTSDLYQRLKTYSGIFECHITVALPPNQPEKLLLFENICKNLGGKAIIIQLTNGITPTHPMIGKILKGDADAVLSQILALIDGLSRYFSIIRLKIEAGISNNNLPVTTKDAELLPSSCYFEYHLKMLLDKAYDLKQLRALFLPYHGYVSKNTLKKDNNNNSHWESRFVTQRFRLSKMEAEEHLSELLVFVNTQNIKIQKVIREFNIFDSNSDLDAGWI